MTTEVEILIIEIPGIIETGLIVVIVEIPETGLTEVTVGIDFILETMIIEIIKYTKSLHPCIPSSCGRNVVNGAVRL